MRHREDFRTTRLHHRLRTWAPQTQLNTTDPGPRELRTAGCRFVHLLHGAESARKRNNWVRIADGENEQGMKWGASRGRRAMSRDPRRGAPLVDMEQENESTSARRGVEARRRPPGAICLPGTISLHHSKERESHEAARWEACCSRWQLGPPGREAYPPWFTASPA